MKGYIAVLLCFTSISMVVAQQAKQCGENQEPGNCRECIRTCANYKNPPSCSVVCESGCPQFCNCKKNYVYEYEGGKCIPIEQCSRACASNGAGASDQGASAPDLGSDTSASSSSSSSSGNDGSADSSSSSSASGNNGGAASSSSSSASGNNGGAASSSSSSASGDGDFAPARPFRRRQFSGFGPSAQGGFAGQKPKNCNRPNEVFDDCGTSCEKTCYTKDDRNNACAQQCKPGCRCKKGFVRNEEGDCIYADNCFRCSSKPNEIWKPCGKNCEPTCKVPNPEICSQQCTPDCRCKKGFVRYLGICVNDYECPSS